MIQAVKLKIKSMLNFLGNNATGVYSQKKTSVIEGSVNRCSQTKCLYFVLELNQILLLTGDTVIHKGEEYSFEYNVKDMIECLITTNRQHYYYYASTPKDVTLMIYPHIKEFKKIIKIHVSSKKV